MQSPFLLLVVVVAMACQMNCHQGLFEPKDLIRGTARGGKPEWFNTKEATFPCKYNDINAAQRQYPVNQRVYKPGQSIELVWPRNNHNGGFIAVTLVPHAKSGNKGEMENPSNVIMYACAQQSCRGDSQYNRFNGPSICSQQSGGNCMTCRLTVPIPSHVPTGTYTIQWRLFSHYDSSGVPNRALMDYATCLDLKIDNPKPSAKPRCPAMVGSNCEHFKGVTDINQMLGGEREQGSRNDKNSFVARGVPSRVQQCKA